MLFAILLENVVVTAFEPNSIQPVFQLLFLNNRSSNSFEELNASIYELLWESLRASSPILTEHSQSSQYGLSRILLWCSNLFTLIQFRWACQSSTEYLCGLWDFQILLLVVVSREDGSHKIWLADYEENMPIGFKVPN